MAPSEKEHQILGLETDPGRLTRNVLDLRSRQAFAAVHLRGGVNLPLEEGPAGWWEPARLEVNLPSIHLPPRHEPLLVVASRQTDADLVAGHLAARDRAAVAGIGLTEADLALLPEAWLERGRTRHHLWQPPPWLAAHLDLLPPPTAGPVLDLACGSGRAMVWLA